MKHTTYIICIAILALLVLVQDGFMISNNRIISTQRDKAAYWRGRYDSMVNEAYTVFKIYEFDSMPYKNSTLYHSIVRDSIIRKDIFCKEKYDSVLHTGWHYFDGGPTLDTLRIDSIIWRQESSSKIWEVKSKDKGRIFPVRHSRYRNGKRKAWNRNYMILDSAMIYNHASPDSAADEPYIVIDGLVSKDDSIGTKYTRYNGKQIEQDGEYVIQVYHAEYGFEQETFYNGYLVRMEYWYHGKKVDDEFFPRIITYFKLTQYYPNIHHH